MLGMSVPDQVTLGEMALGLWVLGPHDKCLYSQSYHQLRGTLVCGCFPTSGMLSLPQAPLPAGPAYHPDPIHDQCLWIRTFCLMESKLYISTHTDDRCTPMRVLSGLSL